MKAREFEGGRSIIVDSKGQPVLIDIDHRLLPNDETGTRYGVMFVQKMNTGELRTELEETMDRVISERVPAAHAAEAREELESVLEKVDESLAAISESCPDGVELECGMPIPIGEADLGQGHVLVLELSLN